MAELDLPTLQLQRYFQLVARRKHALVPFAVVGAIIGGIVAFLIPRYYEAYTMVRLDSHVLDTPTNNPAIDPFLRQVQNAREVITGPGFVAEAIGAIGNDPWTDHMPVGGQYARVHPKVAQAAKRVLFRDFNEGRGRTSALLYIAYRDRDPRRAADLANSLLELFLEREKDRVIGRARKELDIVKDQRDKQERIVEELARKVGEFEFNNNVPSVDPGNNQSNNPWTLIYKDWSDAATEYSRLQGDLEGNKARIAAIEKQINDGLFPEQIPASAAGIDPVVANRLAVLTTRLQLAEESLRLQGEMHPLTPYTTRYAALLRERIEKEKRLVGLDDTGKQPNPEFAIKMRELAGLAADQQQLKAKLEASRKRELELRALKDRLPTLRGQHSLLVADLNDARKVCDGVRASYASKELQYGELVSLGNFWEIQSRAFAPDEATYPEVWLIALAGCFAGMLAAFVLLIVVDFFQNTFKTVDDVQRGLPVPVLGVTGYMESEAEIRVLRRRRMAVSLSSVAALFLVSAVVGLYLWDKTKLPVFVYSMLDKVLGR